MVWDDGSATPVVQGGLRVEDEIVSEVALSLWTTLITYYLQNGKPDRLFELQLAHGWALSRSRMRRDITVMRRLASSAPVVPVTNGNTAIIMRLYGRQIPRAIARVLCLALSILSSSGRE